MVVAFSFEENPFFRYNHLKMIHTQSQETFRSSVKVHLYDLYSLFYKKSAQKKLKTNVLTKAMDTYVDGKEVPSFIYSVEFEKPGGLVMPIIVELTYADGTTERQTFPAQIWMQDDTSVKRVFSATQEIVSFKLDPDEETADVDTSNNSWPKKEATKFENFKNKVKG